MGATGDAPRFTDARGRTITVGTRVMFLRGRTRVDGIVTAIGRRLVRVDVKGYKRPARVDREHVWRFTQADYGIEYRAAARAGR